MAQSTIIRRLGDCTRLVEDHGRNLSRNGDPPVATILLGLSKVGFCSKGEKHTAVAVASFQAEDT